MMEQQQQQQQMQMMQMQQESEMKKEEMKHKNAIELEQIKGEIALNKQAILALGFVKNDEEKDSGEDSTPLVIEQLKASTQDLERRYKERVSEADLRQRRIDSDRRFLLSQQEQQNKARETNARIETANRQLQIAQINKNRYD